MKKHLLLLVLIIFSLSAFKITAGNALPKPIDKLNVWLLEGVRLKRSPSEKSKTLTTIAYGTTVNVTKNTSPAPYIVDFKSAAFKTPYKLKGNWIKVEFNGKQGYVFDGYLSAMPVLHQDAKGIIESEDAYLKRNYGVLKILKLHPKKDAETATTYYKNGTVNKESTYDGCTDNELILKNLTLNEAVLFQKVLYKDADAAENIKIKQAQDKAIKISSYSCD